MTDSPPPSAELNRYEPSGTVRSATRWNAVGKAIVMATRWLVQIWLLKILAVEDFGDMAVAVSFTGLLLLFTDFGTGQAVVQRKTLDAAYLSTVFWLNIAIGAALFLGVWAVSAAIAAFSAPSTLTSILPVLASSFAILSIGIVPRGLLTRRLQFGRMALVQIAEAVTYGALAIALGVGGHGVWALVIGTVAGSAVSVVAVLALAGWRPQFAARRSALRELWSFSINLLGARVSDHVFLEADRVVIYATLGSEATGFYYAAQQLVVFPIATTTQVLAAVLVPALARLQTDIAEFRARLLRAMAGLTIIVAPMLFGLAAVLEPTVNGFLGDPSGAVEKWGPAVAPALVLVVASYLRTFFITTASVFVAMAETKLMFRWTLILGVSLITSYLIGAALFGVIGVAIGYTVVHVLLAPTIVQKACGLVDLELREVVRAVRVPLAIAVAMAVMVAATVAGLSALGVSKQVQAVGGAMFGGVLYLVGLIVFRPSGFDDLARLVGVSKLIRRRP